MSAHEVNSHSLDFEKVAEQSAMDKVTDIHLDPTLKHSFVRFAPLVIDSENEETANQKVDRLEGVLRYGLVAENFAKRIDIPISRNWHDRLNKRYVSLNHYSQSLEYAFFLGTLNALHGSTQTQIPREGMYMILVKKGFPLNKGFPYSTRGEVWAQNRIAPRFFMGIVIIDGTGEDVSQSLRERIDFTTSSTQDTLTMVLEKMQSICKNKLSLFFPIYGLSGSLYWPRKMSYQEVQKFVGERRSNGA